MCVLSGHITALENRRMSIFAEPPYEDPIHVTVPGHPGDPRSPAAAHPGIVVHYVPELHPDDLDVVRGIPVTSVSRTLIDMAEEADEEELREIWCRAREMGLLDADALAASRGRVEWRPSLALVDRLIAEFTGGQ